ncbi:hypothetical protein C2G38_2237237 [Gigaspora rosea]|uniref:Uncharacterized protein n=1 Tax=Gigaspora rosea TaxID=44941 RepID=A0A397TSE6_9GLOM|nr:hypothetical protein C2G38_2237237 [Gigaspora rosea]
MVLVQDENEVQEVLPATLALESGEGEGLSEVGIKRDLVERLAGRVVSKSKRKERIDDNGQVNNVMQNGEKNRYWPREKFGKARDQFEYDKWCKGVCTESGQEGGSNVVAGIRDPLDNDPMEVFFQEKLASARQSQEIIVQGEISTYGSMLLYSSAY